MGAKPWHEIQSTALAIRDQSFRLRAVLQNGANESLYFRRHLPSYRTAVVSLTHLFQASLELVRQQEEDPQYLGDIGSYGCVRLWRIYPYRETRQPGSDLPNFIGQA